MDPLTELSAASLAFVVTHFALSHPLRAQLISRVGEKGFLPLYSLVAVVTLSWMILAFRSAPPADLSGSGEIGWLVATVMTLPALVLFLGSLRGNPAFPDPRQSGEIKRAADGAFAVTRHPMMWGFALWALSHIVLWWSWRTVIVSAAVLVLALVGAHLQDRKKEALLGDGWTHWEAQTSYWPRLGRLLGAGAVLWLLALALWLALTWVHIPAAGIPAGVWRWLG